MPRKQVYGKRSTHVYSNFAGFASPVKPRKQSDEAFEVLEVAEELERLTVHDATTPEKQETPDALTRSPLATRDGNAKCRPSKKKSRHTKVESNALNERTPTREAEEVASSGVESNIPAEEEEKVESHRPAEALPILANNEDANIVASLPPKHEEALPIQEAPCSPPICAAPDQPVKPQVKNVYTDYVESLLSLSSRPLASFDDWSDQLSSHFAITKIAEASFGEVYRLSLLRPHPALGRADESVLKIIALKAPPASRKKMGKASKKRMEMMSDPEDVASEVRLMQRMTTIPGYTMFRECCILQGRPGASFVSAWRDWNEVQESKGKDPSVFPDPGRKASYSEKQLWAVIEMQDAGTDLENVELKDIWATWDVFWGVVLALGKGEEHVGFEHRDLHMGNICVSKRHCQADASTAGNTMQIDPTKRLGFTGIETTLIDYTISRAELGRSVAGGEEDVAFLDLEKDLTLFEGDAEEEYQYEIYRHMRAAMYLDDPLADLWERWDEVEASGRTWRGYHPQTNLVWLHFILHKLLEQLEWPSSTRCYEAENGPSLEKASQLEQAFVQMQELLDPHQLPSSGLRSAGDLVQLAIRKGWLEEQDIKGSAPIPKAKGRRKARAVRQRK